MTNETTWPRSGRIGMALLAAAWALAFGAGVWSTILGSPLAASPLVFIIAVIAIFVPASVLEGGGLVAGAAAALVGLLGTLFLGGRSMLAALSPALGLCVAFLFLMAMLFLLRALLTESPGDSVERSHRLRRRGRHAAIVFAGLAAIVALFAVVIEPRSASLVRGPRLSPDPGCDGFRIVLATLVVGLIFTAVLLWSGRHLREASWMAKWMSLGPVFVGAWCMPFQELPGLLPAIPTGFALAAVLILSGIAAEQMAIRVVRRRRERNAERHDLTGRGKISLAEARRAFGVGNPARWTSR